MLGKMDREDLLDFWWINALFLGHLGCDVASSVELQ